MIGRRSGGLYGEDLVDRERRSRGRGYGGWLKGSSVDIYKESQLIFEDEYIQILEKKSAFSLGGGATVCGGPHLQGDGQEVRDPPLHCVRLGQGVRETGQGRPLRRFG
jgi:hypothetical protein